MTETPQIKISDIVQTDYFNAALQVEIAKIKDSINSRPQPKPGMKYRRTVIDNFKSFELSADFFQSQLLEIWQKTSVLPKSKRDFIEAVCHKVLREIIDEIKKHNEVISQKESTVKA